MAAGFEVYDSGGVLQASSEFFGYFCRKTGTGVTGTSVFGNTVPSEAVIAMPAGVVKPIVAIICGSALGLAVAGANYRLSCAGPVGTAFTYYIFDRADALPASNNGLEIYNSTGEITFSSNFHPLVAMDALASPGAAESYPGFTPALALLSYGGHRQLAVGGPICFDSGPSIWFPGQPCDDLRYHLDAKVYGGKVVGHDVTTLEISFDDVEVRTTADLYEEPPLYVIPTTLLVLDVTNIPVPATFF